MNNLWRGHKETKLRNLAENDVTERQALMREAIRNTNCEGGPLRISRHGDCIENTGRP